MGFKDGNLGTSVIDMEINIQYANISWTYQDVYSNGMFLKLSTAINVVLLDFGNTYTNSRY